MDKRIALRNSFLGALFFGFLAPPIGSLGFSIPLAIYAFIAKPGTEAVILALGGLLGLTFWSYLVGFIPAAITGFLAGSFRSNFSSWRYCFAVGALGCFTACLCLLGLPGLIGGTVSARLFSEEQPN